jgi:hypothetical protein
MLNTIGWSNLTQLVDSALKDGIITERQAPGKYTPIKWLTLQAPRDGTPNFAVDITMQGNGPSTASNVPDDADKESSPVVGWVMGDDGALKRCELSNREVGENIGDPSRVEVSSSLLECKI